MTPEAIEAWKSMAYANKDTKVFTGQHLLDMIHDRQHLLARLTIALEIMVKINQARFKIIKPMADKLEIDLSKIGVCNAAKEKFPAFREILNLFESVADLLKTEAHADPKVTNYKE